MRLIVIPEAHRKVAEAAVRAALLADGTAGDDFVFTLVRLPGRPEWQVHVSSAAGTHDRVARLIQKSLHDAGI